MDQEKTPKKPGLFNETFAYVATAIAGAYVMDKNPQ
jgi:hypothetical protein